MCNVFPIDKPIISIPRMRIKASTKDYLGTTTTESYIPTATKLIRAGQLTVNTTPGTNTNVFTSLGIDSDLLKMNRRYTLMTHVQVTETTTAPATVVHNVEVSFRPDARNQISRDFTFDSAETPTVEITGNVTSHINYEKGIITFQCVLDAGTSTSSFVVNSAEFTMRFIPINTMNGRTKVSIETEMTDVTVDPESINSLGSLNLLNC